LYSDKFIAKSEASIIADDARFEFVSICCACGYKSFSENSLNSRRKSGAVLIVFLVIAVVS